MQPSSKQVKSVAPALPMSPPPIPRRPPPLPTKPTFAVPAPRPRTSPSPSFSASPSPSPAESIDTPVGSRLNRSSSVPSVPVVVSDGEEQQRRRLHIVAHTAHSDRQYHTDADDNSASPSPSPCSPATPLHSSQYLRGRSVSITTMRAAHSSLSIEAPRRSSELSLLRPVSPMQHSQPINFNPLDGLSPSRRLISTAQSLPSDAPSLSTFKLAAYTFTAASARPHPTVPPPFTLTLDPVAQTCTVASMDGSVFHCRPFQSLAMCTHSLDEPTSFTIYYVEGKATSRCVALSSGEAIMQYTMLMSFIDQVRSALPASPQQQHTPNLLLATRILKKSQLRWKPLYLTLHPFLVTLHSSHRLRQEDVLKRVNLQGCTVREWREGGSSEDRERVLVLEQPGGKATQFKCASSSEREMVIVLIRKAMSRQTEGGADSDWSDRTEESKGEVEERRPSMFSEMHQRLQVSTSPEGGKSVQLSLASPSSFTSLSSVGEHYDTTSPHSSPSPPPPVLTSPAHRSVAHAAQLRQVKQSRRRSRRSMSKDFQQLKDREAHIDTSASSSSSSSSSSAPSATASRTTTAALTEFVELPSDPRPPPVLSSAVGVGVYQLLSTLLASLMGGCAVSGVMYVPRAVWWQQGRKVQAYALKVQCFELLYENVLSISPPPAAGQQSTGGGRSKEAEEMLYSVRCVMDDIHERLAQYLPYLQPPNAATRCRPRTGQSSNKAKDVMQRLLVKGKDVTSVGWRRLDGDEVRRYCTAVQHVLEAVTIFGQWHAWLDRGELSGDGGTWAEVRNVLAGVDVWLYGVLCNVLLHDLMVAVRRYMKYAMRLLQEKHQMRGGWSGQKGGGSAVAAVVGRGGLKASNFLQSAQR